jgi:hypothetical protein
MKLWNKKRLTIGSCLVNALSTPACPGLAANNTSHNCWKIFHISSGWLVETASSKKIAMRILINLGINLDWTVSESEIPYRIVYSMIDRAKNNAIRGDKKQKEFMAFA